MRIIIGVDGHKAQHTLVATNEVGQPIAELTIDNDPQGYEQAWSWARSWGENRVWGMENHARLVRGLAQYVIVQGDPVFEVSPHLTGRKRQRSRDHAKSDAHDALAVARVVLQEEGHLPRVPPEDETTELHVWVEQRDNLVADRTRMINQLHAQLTEVEPHYKARLGELGKDKALRRCRRYPMPEDDPIGQARSTVIRQLASFIQQLNKHIAILEARIEPLVLRIAPCLLSIQGIKFLNAAKLIARVGRIEQVASAASLANYSGIAPIRHGTAGNEHHRVNRKGDRQLHAVFYRIAMVQSAHNPLAQAYLAKKKAEGKTSKQAFRCLRRRMVDIVYAVWKKGEPYQAPAVTAEAA